MLSMIGYGVEGSAGEPGCGFEECQDVGLRRARA